MKYCHLYPPQTIEERDLVNFYDNISKKEASPPKLLSYRRLPSVTSTDAYSEKDTASDTEVTKAIKKIPLATRSCRSSPTAPHRYANTYIVLGPPGCTQAFPYLSPGPLDCWWYKKTKKPLASRN